MSLVNPQTDGRANEESTLKKLIDINEQYLIERSKFMSKVVKISDVPKPSKYSHKMPSKTGHSEYNQRFGSTNKSYNFSESTPQRNKTASLMKLPNQQVAGYWSTYHVNQQS